MSLFLGVDPGVTGALALVCTERGLLEVAGVPVCSNGTSGVVTREVDVRETGELLRAWSDRHGLAREHLTAVIERPQAMRTSVTALSQGDSYGVLRAIAGMWAQRVERVHPAAWKRMFGLTGEGKGGSVECARRLYGEQLPKRLRNDLAEAVLLARWGVVTLQ